MVATLLSLIAGLVRAVATAPSVLELAAVVCIAVWAGATFGTPAVFLVAGIALAARSVEVAQSDDEGGD